MRECSLSSEERKAYAVAIQEGRFFRGERVYSTVSESVSENQKQGWCIFVLSQDQKLYCGSGTVGYFHHTSFVAHEPVLAAGEARVDRHGVLKELTNESGHYQPGREQTLALLHFLNTQGVDLRGVTYYEFLQETIRGGFYSAANYLSCEGTEWPDFFTSTRDKRHFDLSFAPNGLLTITETVPCMDETFIPFSCDAYLDLIREVDARAVPLDQLQLNLVGGSSESLIHLYRSIKERQA